MSAPQTLDSSPNRVKIDYMHVNHFEHLIRKVFFFESAVNAIIPSFTKASGNREYGLRGIVQKSPANASPNSGKRDYEKCLVQGIYAWFCVVRVTNIFSPIISSISQCHLFSHLAKIVWRIGFLKVLLRAHKSMQLLFLFPFPPHEN